MLCKVCPGPVGTGSDFIPPLTSSSIRCEHPPDDSLIAHDLPFNRPSAAMPQAFITISIAATFSSNGLVINENILKVEKTAVHLQLQTIDNQLKFTEDGAPDFPPSVTDPAYTHSNQGRQLKVGKTSVHLKLQMIGSQFKLTEGGSREQAWDTIS